MSSVKVLDCTLRDGGYCNKWGFGSEGAKAVTSGLFEAKIDIIECGFVSDLGPFPSGSTKFNSIPEASSIIPEHRDGRMFVAMANFGEINVDNVPERDASTIDGIRVAFHKKDRYAALDLCSQLKKKGYDIFIQAMVSISYSDEDFLDLISRANEISPYAFYIVDSFGLMKRKDMLRFFYLIDNNLNPSITLGFHSHNNMQLAFANAQTLIDLRPARGLIIDSSVFGMGRGAGNLCTELLVEHLNGEIGSSYDLGPILGLMDGVIGKFYAESPWGYTLPNYLSAAYGAHPNYASFFDDKKTLTVEGMGALFAIMDDSKKLAFDPAYAEDLYLKYMATGETQEENRSEFETVVFGKSVLLVAPGKSSIEEIDAVKRAASQPDVLTMSVNFDYPELDVDYVFLSNSRRFRNLENSRKSKCIVTSNVPADIAYLKVDYASLLNDVDGVRDNAGLMAVSFLVRCGVHEVLLAGFDGYARNPKENYGYGRLEIAMREAVAEAMNEGMSEVLGALSEQVKIDFVTKPRYIKVGKK